MSALNKWNAKKKKLGYIPSEMSANRSRLNFTENENINELLTIKKMRKTTKSNKNSRNIRNSSSSGSSSNIELKKGKTLTDLYRAVTRSISAAQHQQQNHQNRIQAEPPTLLTPNPLTSARAIVNHNKAATLLRISIAAGGGNTDAKKNLNLAAAIRRARELGVQPITLQQIIRKSKLIADARPVALMQLRYQRKVYIICTVLTRSQSEFQLQLMPMLKPHFAGFAPVLSHFTSQTLIDAVVPANVCREFRNINRNVRLDGYNCGANDAKVKDYELGLWSFRVNALIASDVATALMEKGYRIVNISYDFKPKRLVDLNLQEQEAYNNFLWKLRQIPEIDGMFDNVRNSVANKVETPSI